MAGRAPPSPRKMVAWAAPAESRALGRIRSRDGGSMADGEEDEGNGGEEGGDSKARKRLRDCKMGVLLEELRKQSVHKRMLTFETASVFSAMGHARALRETALKIQSRKKEVIGVVEDRWALPGGGRRSRPRPLSLRERLQSSTSLFSASFVIRRTRKERARHRAKLWAVLAQQALRAVVLEQCLVRARERRAVEHAAVVTQRFVKGCLYRIRQRRMSPVRRRIRLVLINLSYIVKISKEVERRRHAVKVLRALLDAMSHLGGGVGSVMHRYHKRVQRAQHVWRGYKLVTIARVMMLSRLWASVERDLLVEEAEETKAFVDQVVNGRYRARVARTKGSGGGGGGGGGEGVGPIIAWGDATTTLPRLGLDGSSPASISSRGSSNSRVSRRRPGSAPRRLRPGSGSSRRPASARPATRRPRLSASLGGMARRRPQSAAGAIRRAPEPPPSASNVIEIIHEETGKRLVCGRVPKPTPNSIKIPIIRHYLADLRFQHTKARRRAEFATRRVTVGDRLRITRDDARVLLHTRSSLASYLMGKHLERAKGDYAFITPPFLMLKNARRDMPRLVREGMRMRQATLRVAFAKKLMTGRLQSMGEVVPPPPGAVALVHKRSGRVLGTFRSMSPSRPSKPPPKDADILDDLVRKGDATLVEVDEDVEEDDSASSTTSSSSTTSTSSSSDDDTEEESDEDALQLGGVAEERKKEELRESVRLARRASEEDASLKSLSRSLTLGAGMKQYEPLGRRKSMRKLRSMGENDFHHRHRRLLEAGERAAPTHIIDLTERHRLSGDQAIAVVFGKRAARMRRGSDAIAIPQFLPTIDAGSGDGGLHPKVVRRGGGGGSGGRGGRRNSMVTDALISHVAQKPGPSTITAALGGRKHSMTPDLVRSTSMRSTSTTASSPTSFAAGDTSTSTTKLSSTTTSNPSTSTPREVPPKTRFPRKASRSKRIAVKGRGKGEGGELKKY